jgi:hypothetical protein
MSIEMREMKLNKNEAEKLFCSMGEITLEEAHSMNTYPSFPENSKIIRNISNTEDVRKSATGSKRK